MKTIALRLFGAAISSRLGSKLLMAYAFRTPHRHLRDLDGELYMGRWRVVDEDTFGGWLLEKLTGFASVRLHRIMRPDNDRDLHNHPFYYRSFIVKGHYSEEFAEPGFCGDTSSYSTCDGHVSSPLSYRFVHKGQTVTGGIDKFHRIDDVSVGGVWTLFCMTRNGGEWGFNVAGKFVNSTRYLLRKGYTRSHVEEVQTV